MTVCEGQLLGSTVLLHGNSMRQGDRVGLWGPGLQRGLRNKEGTGWHRLGEQ